MSYTIARLSVGITGRVCQNDEVEALHKNTRGFTIGGPVLRSEARGEFPQRDRISRANGRQPNTEALPAMRNRSSEFAFTQINEIITA